MDAATAVAVGEGDLWAEDYGACVWGCETVATEGVGATIEEGAAA